MRLKERHKINKEAKVGDTCTCPSCGTEFIKVSYHQVFCKTKAKTKCKDFYYNSITPNKRNNTTRISPANARYYTTHIEPRKSMVEDIDPSDSEYWDHSDNGHSF